MEADFSDAVEYHYDKFPPNDLDVSILLDQLLEAASTIARYDVLLQQMHNSEILLESLRKREAVISSRIEGTVTTLEEVLEYEADKDEGEQNVGRRFRHEAFEVYAYSSSMQLMQNSLNDGASFAPFLIRQGHRSLLRFGRGAHLQPGEFKTEQNYLADRTKKKILFVPIRPEQLQSGIDRLFQYINSDIHHPIIRTAITHIEFEALHPFKDGNGRMGRMMIPLQLWQQDQISSPHFYVSPFFEEHRDEYIDRMRLVSQTGDWTQWVQFFVTGLTVQAQNSIETIQSIQGLFDDLKNEFRDLLASKHYLSALEFMFKRPIFRNNTFTNRAGIPRPTAARFTRILVEKELLRVVQPGSGRRPALLAFDPLLNLIRA